MELFLLLRLFLFLRRTASYQVSQFAVQPAAARLGQLQEAKGLEASIRGPHGKQHLRPTANTGVAEVEQDGYSNAFVEGMFNRDQAPVNRELTHPAADLTSVFQQHQGED